MSRNVRTYDHFCVLARALERLGDRWSLLVVRDLLSGPKRFTDLMNRLGGITPKTLSQRLGELEDGGILQVDRQAGRREVWYELTPAGVELAPAIDGLSWWGWRHAWRPPRPGEKLHGEHLLRAIILLLDRSGTDHKPALWHIRFVDDGDYTIASDGAHWSLTSAPPQEAPQVTVTTTAAAWAQFVADPTLEHAAELDVGITGNHAAVARFVRLMRTFADAARHQPST